MITQDFYRTKVMTSKLTKKDAIELKIMTAFPLHGVKPGETIKVEVDKDGMPINKHWRKRVIDSKIDGCVEIVKSETKTTITKKDKD